MSFTIPIGDCSILLPPSLIMKRYFIDCVRFCKTICLSVGMSGAFGRPRKTPKQPAVVDSRDELLVDSV